MYENRRVAFKLIRPTRIVPTHIHTHTRARIFFGRAPIEIYEKKLLPTPRKKLREFNNIFTGPKHYTGNWP